MKFLIAVAAIAIAAFIGWKVYQQWEEVKEEEGKPKVQAVQVPASQLEGMDSALEGPLAQAQSRGAKGLRDFLAVYRKTMRDPRLASVELDYVVLVAREDLGEARRVFSRVKERTSESSPIYPRVKQLETTYE